MSGLLQIYLGVSWRMAAVITAWLVIRLILRQRIPARVLAAAWVVVMTGLVLPWRWPSELSPFNWMPRPPVVQTEVMNEPESELAAAPASPPRSATDIPRPLLSGASVPTTRSTSSPATNDAGVGSAWLYYVWLAGALFLMATRAWHWMRSIRTLAFQHSDTAQELTDLVSACARELRIAVPVTVCETSAVSVPSICGIRQPLLLFPPGFSEKLSARELRLVLLHELGHWCRRDLWLYELTFFARALHWYNPLVWIAAALARDDSEAACDEFVLHRMPSREITAYGSALLKALGIVRDPPGRCVGLGLFGNKQKLQHRIQMIANYQRPGAVRTLIGAAAVVALLAVCVTQEQLHAQNTPPGAVLGGITTVAPTGWTRNGLNAENYIVGVDGTQSHVRPTSAYVRSVGPGSAKDFGGMMQMFDAGEYRGKRLRFSAWIKAQNADKGAQLWMRIDGPVRGESLQFDNMDLRPHPTGTTDWQLCVVVLDVPAEATAVALGFFIKQTGQAWVNDAKLEVVDDSVPSTNMKTPGGSLRKLPPAPANLEFSSAF